MSGTPHLLVAPEKVVAVLLADGWHKIVSGSFTVGALSVGTPQLTNPDHGAGWPASGVCHGVFHLDRDPRPERAVHRRARPGLRQFPAHLAPDGRRAQVALRIRRVPRRSAGDIRARSG